MSRAEFGRLLKTVLDSCPHPSDTWTGEMPQAWQRITAHITNSIPSSYTVRSSNLAGSPKLPMIGISHENHSSRLSEDLTASFVFDPADTRVLLILMQGTETTREVVNRTSERLPDSVLEDKLLDRLGRLGELYRTQLNGRDTAGLEPNIEYNRVYFDDIVTSPVTKFYGPASIIHYEYSESNLGDDSERQQRQEDPILDDLTAMLRTLSYFIEDPEIPHPKEAQVSYNSLWYDRDPTTTTHNQLRRVATVDKTTEDTVQIGFYDVGFNDDDPEIRHVGTGSIPRDRFSDEALDATFIITDQRDGEYVVTARLGSAKVGLQSSSNAQERFRSVITAVTESNPAEGGT